MMEFVVQETMVNQRIDQVLSTTFGVSRAHIQHMIKEGLVQKSDTPLKSSFMVHAGDKVILLQSPTESPLFILSKRPLDILYEDTDVLVINKPAGIAVHPTHEHDTQETLVEALLQYLPSIKNIGDSPLRPGLVHRLDKGVSGVMIIAKTPSAFLFLKHQFAERLVQKNYLGLVYGTLPNETGTMRFRIGRSKTQGRMVAYPEMSEEGKEAITHYEILQSLKTTTFVKIHIETGRTHQIRVHFYASDHPIVGDPLYKKQHMKHIKPIPLARLFLHSSSLTCTLPNGNTQTFESPLPSELFNLLESLS